MFLLVHVIILCIIQCTILCDKRNIQCKTIFGYDFLELPIKKTYFMLIIGKQINIFMHTFPVYIKNKIVNKF